MTLDLTSSASPDDIAALSFADLIRAGNAQGLLAADWTEWRRFREMRTRTSHTYDVKAAQDVVASVPAFLKEAEHLLTELQRRPV